MWIKYYDEWEDDDEGNNGCGDDAGDDDIGECGDINANVDDDSEDDDNESQHSSYCT